MENIVSAFPLYLMLISLFDVLLTVTQKMNVYGMLLTHFRNAIFIYIACDRAVSALYLSTALFTLSGEAYFLRRDYYSPLSLSTSTYIALNVCLGSECYERTGKEIWDVVDQYYPSLLLLNTVLICFPLMVKIRYQ